MTSQTGEPGGDFTTQETHARYQQIARALAQDIADGVYAPGALLPSINDVSARWQVSDGTARRALRELVAHGWARADPRRGHTVPAELPLPRNGIGRATLPDFGAATQSQALPHVTGAIPTMSATAQAPRPPYTVPLGGVIPPMLSQPGHIYVGLEPAPADAAHALGLPGPGQPAVVRRRIMTDAQGVLPVELRISYLPPDIANGTPLAKPEPLPEPWPQPIATHTSSEPTTATTTLHARPVDGYEASQLQLPPHSYVLTQATTHYDPQGTPIDHTVSIWPADSTTVTASRYPLSP